MSDNSFNFDIETERLVLRPLVIEDAADLLGIFSDAEVMRYWNTPPWASIEDAYKFINESNEAMLRHESFTLGIYSKPACELIGKCMLFSYVKESRRAEIGFGLGRLHWGKGYIAEARCALIGFGFEKLGLRRIEAEIDPNNRSSAKALERLGFSREGFLRQRWEINGVVSDSALYGMLIDDWVEKSKGA